MKRWIGISVVAVMAAMSLSGCSKGGSGGSDAGTSTAAAPAAKHDPVKLVIQNGYNNDDEARFMQDYGNLIIKKFPYISIEYSPVTQIDSRVTAGGDIDIDMTSVGLTPTRLLDYNLQYDISPLIAKNKYDLSRLEPTTIQMQRDFANGGIYGLPVNTTTLSLFYNKDIFDKFGVSYPKDAMTWDDIYDLAKKVSRTDGSVKYRGFDYDATHYVRMNQLSQVYLDPKTNVPLYTNDNWKKIVQNFTRFNQIPGNESPNFQNFNVGTTEFVKNKTLAMLYIASNTIMQTGNLEGFKQVNWDVVSGPYFKDLMGVSAQSYPLFFYISATSKHKDDAFDVISYLTSEEFQLQQSQQGVMSILKDDKKVIDAFGQNADIFKGKNVKALIPTKYADPMPYNKYSSVADAPLLTGMKEVAQGKKDINTAMRDAVDAADKAVKTKMSQ